MPGTTERTGWQSGVCPDLLIWFGMKRKTTSSRGASRGNTPVSASPSKATFTCVTLLDQRHYNYGVKRVSLTRRMFRSAGDSADKVPTISDPRPRNYNSFMARGWESKSVEAPQAEAGERAAKPRPRLTPEDASRARNLETLRLSRQRVVQQLERAQNPRHRQLLQDELSALDARVKQFQT